MYILIPCVGAILLTKNLTLAVIATHAAIIILCYYRPVMQFCCTPQERFTLQKMKKCASAYFSNGSLTSSCTTTRLQSDKCLSQWASTSLAIWSVTPSNVLPEKLLLTFILYFQPLLNRPWYHS